MRRRGLALAPWRGTPSVASRDADRALQPLVKPRSKHLPLVALRSYALAQLARPATGTTRRRWIPSSWTRRWSAGCGRSRVNLDPQARRPFCLPARALLLLASSEPGSALLMLTGDSSVGDSAELAVVQTRVYTDLEKPKQAADELATALRLQLPIARGPAGRGAGRRSIRRTMPGRPSSRCRPSRSIQGHWPSLLLLGRLALRSGAADPTRANPPDEPGPAEPGRRGFARLEQCQAHLELIELDLLLGHMPGILTRFDALARTEDLPMSCRLDLARLNRRLGRKSQALALLKAAAAEQEAGDPGEAALLYSEASGDPRVILPKAIKPPEATDLGMKAAARWKARSEASKLQSGVDSRPTEGRGRRWPPSSRSWEVPPGPVYPRLVQGRQRRLPERRSPSRPRAPGGRQGPPPGRCPGRCRRAGPGARFPGVQALASCNEGARRAPANCRALTCEAQALASLHRPTEANAALGSSRRP